MELKHHSFRTDNKGYSSCLREYKDKKINHMFKITIGNYFSSMSDDEKESRLMCSIELRINDCLKIMCGKEVAEKLMNEDMSLKGVKKIFNEVFIESITSNKITPLKIIEHIHKDGFEQGSSVSVEYYQEKITSLLNPSRAYKIVKDIKNDFDIKEKERLKEEDEPCKPIYEPYINPERYYRWGEA